MIVSISTDSLSDQELLFIKSSFSDNDEFKIFEGSKFKQLSEDLTNLVPILIHFTLSSAISGATWDMIKASMTLLFNNDKKALSKEVVVRITTEESTTTISDGKVVIDTKKQHTIIEGATEKLIQDSVIPFIFKKDGGRS